MTPCRHCPCKDICTRSPVYCGYAAADPPDPVQLAHICGASAIHRQAPDESLLPVEESMRLLKAMKACPYRTGGCGCGGARCGLRNGAIVSHLDCFECLKRYG